MGWTVERLIEEIDLLGSPSPMTGLEQQCEARIGTT
jgi:hypothetical protein